MTQNDSRLALRALDPRLSAQHGPNQQRRERRAAARARAVRVALSAAPLHRARLLRAIVTGGARVGHHAATRRVA
ncbi:hypothetical protein ACMGDM_05760 [Sphingomonas sp. DT-51]|uniref:hypothetical protein n=1 Tax=Sphingomonas sp. DT-51 TaxID=3396165 RepID=UPI003F19FDFC